MNSPQPRECSDVQLTGGALAGRAGTNRETDERRNPRQLHANRRQEYFR